jgi:hypothetical protein
LRSSGPAPVKLQLYDKNQAFLMENSGAIGARLANLVLEPGTYYVAVRGKLPQTQRYQLEVADAGAIEATNESEPNNSAARANLVHDGETLRGDLSPQDINDCVAVEVDKSLELWNLEVLGDGADTLKLIDSTNTVVTSASRLNGQSTIRLQRVLLPRGRQALCIEGSHGSWLFRAQRVGPPKPGDEYEPDDRPSEALALAAETEVHGWLDHGGDIDNYFFYLPGETKVVIDLAAPSGLPVSGAIAWGQFGDARIGFKTSPGNDGMEHLHWSGALPAGDYFLALRSDNGESSLDPYTLRVAPAPHFESRPDTDAAGKVSASLEFESAKVAAFSTLAQAVKGTLRLKNSGPQKSSLDVSTWTGDERWKISGLPKKIDVDAGADLKVPVELRVAPDARDDWPINVEIGLNDGTGPIAAVSRVTASTDVAPIAPYSDPSIPEPLLGGLNVAWSALGGKVDPPYAALIDGLTDAKTATLGYGKAVAVELAGSQPHTLNGIILTPPIVSPPREALRQFTVAVSEDGARYNQVLDAELSPLPREQAFVFSSPVKARFVQLTAKSSYDADRGDHALLAEFKVVADPKEPFAGFDVGNPALGGHVVRAAPQPSWPVNGVGETWPMSRVTFLPDRKSAPEIVLGFRADRAARITGLTWQERSDTPAAEHVQRVELAASDNPLGPWTPLGAWDTKQERFDLPAPQTVRYLALRVVMPNQGPISLPAKIGVTEVPAAANYRSILGEWGDESSATDFKSTLVATAAKSTIVAGHSRAAAAALPPDVVATGAVSLGRSEDWYKLDLPPAARGLSFQVTGDPGPEAEIAVESAAGVRLELASDPAVPGKYSTAASPGAYFVRVTQPPLSVIVAWDTSGSVSSFAPGIKRVVQGLSLNLETGREEIELIPFRGPQSVPIIGEWAADRGEVYSVFARYPWNDNSSNSEAAIIAANKAFVSRPGQHAIAIITDAASDGAVVNTELWNGFASVHPRVFSLKVPVADSTADTMAETHLMEDWANSNRGYFGLFASQGSADVHFRRMAARLMQPASYGLSYAVSAGPPAPGRLQLTMAKAGAAAQSAQTAVELLIDASGSMLQKIGGESKIEIEKKLLTDLAQHNMPPGVPLAIRVFGQGGKGSCRTDLVQSLKPLDAAQISGTIAAIHVTNGAKTAIADSLRLIPTDLGQARGQRLLVLITDGEETCGGDPAAEIKKLRDDGFDVLLNIVGFSVDTPAARAQFKTWAALSGGQYFDANDRKSLDEGLRRALLPDVDIVSSSGAVVGHLIVGGAPIDLAPGTYTVRLADSKPKDLGTVQISSGQTSTFEMTP